MRYYSNSVIEIRYLAAVTAKTQAILANSSASFPPQNLNNKQSPELCFLAKVIKIEYLKKKGLKNILVGIHNTEIRMISAINSTEYKYTEILWTVHRHWIVCGNGQIFHSEIIW